jgi:hypothetical protein
MPTGLETMMDTVSISAELRAHRERLVLDHFADEIKQDFDAVLATFPHPHYEIIPNGDVYDGNDGVRAYYTQSRKAFPDQRSEIIKLAAGHAPGRAQGAAAHRQQLPLPHDRAVPL